LNKIRENEIGLLLKKMNSRLANNQFAIVDNDMYELLNRLKWHARYDKIVKNYYSCRYLCKRLGKDVREYMPWYIVGKPIKGYVVDHINGNTLDNRRSNLRVVTHRENQQNQKVHRRGHQIGSAWQNRKKQWRAQTHIDGRTIYVGSFDTPQLASEASKAYYWKVLNRFKKGGAV